MRQILTLIFAIGLISPSIAQPSDAPKNVILFISDGCGPASFTFARGYLRSIDQGGLAVDEHLVGSISTYSADSRVTDSAASGTAMACGVKTDNGVIAMDTTGRPVATLLEAAEARGMATGLVVTSTISHATPAVFSSHVPNRNDQAEIARQQLGEGIEVLFGGGAEFYLPKDDGGRRDDGVNLFDLAAEKGYAIARNKTEFEGISTVPALGIFADDQMTYEIDRDTTLEPSLSEMARRAIDLLDDDPHGFFLMIEGSRIDHAAHNNDAPAHLHEILEFDRAFAIAAAFAEADGHTLVVSTSDHETGGLSLGRAIDGRAIYQWYPDVVGRVDASDAELMRMAKAEGTNVCDFMAERFELKCSEADWATVQQADSLAPWQQDAIISNTVSRAALIGWTSTGHTGVDVNLYAMGPRSETFAGHHDNTEIAKLIAEAMGFDLESLTTELRRNTP